MAPETHQLDSSVQLGPFAVRTDAAEAAEFAAALQLAAGARAIPLTFPIRWLALPEIRAATEEAIGTPHPLLASQAFHYHASIAPDRDYAFRVAIRRDRAAVPHVTIRGTAHDRDGGLAVELQTVLYPTTAAAGGPNDYPAPGSTLPEVTVGPIDMPHAVRYAAAAHDHNRLHVDHEFARSVGLDAPIIHGMMTMGLFQKALSEWRMDTPVSRLFARFVRPVAVGSRLVIGGRRVPRAGRGADSHEILRLSVRVDNRLVCLGEAFMRDTVPSKPPAS